ncbi:MAG: CDP-glucose 4,6-dehydratase [Candidatus Scalindua sp.]|jgi:CDP-glucose 4,6-dehydratase|nr:CDP-glucose 4,6-dehydratase [Candidatus Scalindua sp.]MBT6227533.1 CDP-glucose 4,6-dehydratase [Candidatus Scalindua sp.]
MKNQNHQLSDPHNFSYNGIYVGKRVLITGHTGFKGSWLVTWLLSLGANVIGYSVGIPTNPSSFQVLNLENKLEHITGDINDLDHLRQVFSHYSPDMVFHLAAQAITRLSYDTPQETFYTNMIGTVNVLECIRYSKSVKAAVIITSDKCYQNVEWVWGYREDDKLGGDDPYSASKACAEIACHSYVKSFFSKDDSPRISTARAGNVIGGGDWAVDRVVPDCMRAFFSNKLLELRNPRATRPWQHVLEPLSGYLWLGVNLLQGNERVMDTSFNFGPLSDFHRTVEDLVAGFSKILKKGEWFISEKDNKEKKESTILSVNCEKALTCLDWHAVLSFEETIRMTAEWYDDFYSGKDSDMYDATIKQIEEYEDFAQKRGLVWAEH